MSFLKRHIRPITVALIIMILVITIYAVLNKKRKSKMVEELYRLIDGEIGVEGSDFKTILDMTSPDQKYLTDKAANGLSKAANSAQIIWEAFFWKDPVTKNSWRKVDDDEEAVKRTLQIKTKAQVRSVMLAFARKYGQELDEFLRKHSSAEELKEYAVIVSKLKD